jgi:signal recognition particle subunit SRP54
MFDQLTQKLEGVLRKLRGEARITPESLRESLREVRRALLEADVNLEVAKDLVAAVERRALGQDVLKGLTPGQQVVGIVHEELVRVLGGARVSLAGSPHLPAVVLLVGLNGSGKTTFAAKLARWLKEKGKRTLLASADVHRPAASDQLERLAEHAGAGFWRAAEATSPAQIGRLAREEARTRGFDFLVLDTAGRWHVDEELMQELESIREGVKPHHVLLVMDGMTGQEAVRVGEAFTRRIGVDGLILTKMDGDARGGAALSLRQVTGKPILFLGVSEKVDGLESFDPQRLASRVLGMGDLLTLVEKARDAVDVERAAVAERRMRKGEFNLEDFLEQLRQMKKMGPLEDVLKMLPGVSRGALAEMGPGQEQLGRYEAILLSMTPRERRHPRVLDGSRRRRIARGSGTTVTDVNRLLRDFDRARTWMKQLRHGPRGLGALRGGMR